MRGCTSMSSCPCGRRARVVRTSCTSASSTISCDRRFIPAISNGSARAPQESQVRRSRCGRRGRPQLDMDNQRGGVRGIARMAQIARTSSCRVLSINGVSGRMYALVIQDGTWAKSARVEAIGNRANKRVYLRGLCEFSLRQHWRCIPGGHIVL